MLVCHCHAVNEAAVERLVASGATRVGHVVRNTKAGTSCGGCLPELRRLCERALSNAALSSAALSSAALSSAALSSAAGSTAACCAATESVPA